MLETMDNGTDNTSQVDIRDLLIYKKQSKVYMYIICTLLQGCG